MARPNIESFTEKRSRLVAELADAKQAHAEAAYRVEYEDADPAELAGAAEAERTLEARIVALGMAEQIAAERARADAEQRVQERHRSAAAEMLVHLAERERIAAQMQEGLNLLTAGAREFAAQGVKLRAAFGKAQAKPTPMEITAELPDAELAIAAALHKAGIRLRSVQWPRVQFEPTSDTALADAIRDAERLIHAVAHDLDPEREQELMA